MGDSLKIRENYGTSWILISFSIIIAVVLATGVLSLLKENPLGQQICITILLIGLYLGALIIAFLFRKRSHEYSVFSYFMASIMLWFVFVSFAPVLFLTVPARLLSIWATLNFLFSILVLNYTFLKGTKSSKTKFYLLSFFVMLSLVFFTYISFKTPMAIEAMWNKMELVFACTATIFAITPLVIRIYFKELKLSSSLFLYLFVWVGFCSSYIYYASLRLGLGNTTQNFGIGVLLFSFILSIVFHATHSKELVFKNSQNEC